MIGTGRPPLNVAMIGYGFMGAAHSHAWRNVGRFFDLPAEPRMAVLCGRTEEAARRAALRFGWAEAETDWRRLVERDDVHVVDICTPGASHAEIAIAALDAGKHVLCEKPLANNRAEAEAMAAAAARAAQRGAIAMVGFNYRRVPALAHARALIASGAIGVARHVRAVYLQDWIVDPQFPLVWRLRAEDAGSGALGDLGAHIVDIAQFLLDDRIDAVTALTETFIRERPLGGASSGLTGGATTTETGTVTVDDAALALARFAGGAVATFEATRFATGHKNGMRIEVNGSLGSLAFDLERLNELEVFQATGEPASHGFRRVLVTEGTHPYMAAWWPPGHVIGWEHTFVHEVRDLVVGIAEGAPPSPTFPDGLQVQSVLEAIEEAARAGSWVSVGAPAR